MVALNLWIWSNVWVGWNVWTWVNSWIWFNYIQKKPTVTQDVTYNKNYPWFDKDDYEILERMANKSWYTWQKKKDLMDELYMQYYPQVINKHKLDQRQQLIKEQANNSQELEWNQKAQNETQVKIADLSQKAKKKFWIDATTPDNEVIDAMIQGIPNGWKLFENYINKWDKTLLYEAWLEEQSLLSKAWQIWTDIVWGAYDSVTWAWRFIAKWAADAIGWTAKQLWADEDKVNSLVQSYKDSLKDFSWEAIGADTDSIAYNVTKWVWDIAQVVAWEWLIKWALQGTTKGAALLNYMKNAPTWQKMIAWGIEWAWDMTLYSIVADSELPSPEEAWVGAVIGAAIPWGARLYWAVKPSIQKAMQKAASQLELSWLLNPAKLNTIKNQLINEWTDLAKAWLKGWEAEDVGKWMIDRGFKWDKATIIKDLWEYAKKSHSLKREVLGASESLHSVDSANKSLEIIHNTIDWVPWLEKRLARVEELMWKEKHTLAELDEIKSILDDTVSIYTNAWDVRAWAVKDWLDKVRKDLRKYIEDAATNEWLGNVKMLNNETQISKALEDAISRKDSADAAREMLSVFSKSAIWGAAWYNVWPFDNDTLWGKLGNIAVWALAWKYLFSTKAKTELAWLINKMSWSSKKELERFVAWDLAAKKLSNKTKKELLNVFEEAWITSVKPTNEMTAEEMNALLKKYSYWDVPALEFKEWVNDAWKNILVWDSKKIISTPSWTALREWQIAEIPNKNIVNEVWDSVVKSQKAKQLEIIKNTNPMMDDIHRGIRSEADIKTWKEAMEDWESFVYWDFTKKDAQKALESWKITVYSSKPIENWNFVSTSKNMAQDYAGWKGSKIYSKEVSIDDVAWLDWDEWQFAKISEDSFK